MNNHKVHEYKSVTAGYQLPRDLTRVQPIAPRASTNFLFTHYCLERSLYHQGLFGKNRRFGVCFSRCQWLQKKRSAKWLQLG